MDGPILQYQPATDITEIAPPRPGIPGKWFVYGFIAFFTLCFLAIDAYCLLAY